MNIPTVSQYRIGVLYCYYWQIQGRLKDTGEESLLYCIRQAEERIRQSPVLTESEKAYYLEATLVEFGVLKRRVLDDLGVVN